MAMQGAAELAQLGESFGDAAAQRVDDGLQLALPGGPVGVPVGGHDPLVDAPGRLDLDMLGEGEHSINSGALSISEHGLAGVEGAADTVERIPGMTTVSEGGLLDTLSAAVLKPVNPSIATT